MPGADLPTHTSPGDFPARLAASVANWKRKLLDLTRRNRALNFKPTKVSTIAIVDEHPAEVFRHIYLDERSIRFKADPTKREAPKKGESAPALDVDGDGEPLDFESESEQALEFVPYDPASVDERHRDDWLQTRLSPEQLDHSLRRIEELARTSIEEQGVNTLFLTLGMLQYRESRDSDVWFRAPLVLLPVQLARKSARSGFSLAAGDDDALVNPALAEFLRLNHGIALPELPDSETIGDAYDLQQFLKGAADAVASQPPWTIQTDIYLGLFSFQKLVMFKDLEANQEAIGLHRLIRQLLMGVGSAVHGLPEEIRHLPLDEEFAPESSHQVVDADSSQMRAAAAVVKGHDIVIEGPPGTGKSQTITNLVAQALAAGKSVLFVAEKMAALDVVHRRLVEAGLGEFCLELHSSKANKRAVMKQLSAALDASLLPVAGKGGGASKRLPDVRAALSDYVAAVHEPYGALAMAPYAVGGELGRYLDAPRVRLNADISGVTREQLYAADRALADLAVHAAAIGDPAAHPWRDTGRTLYSEDDLEHVTSIARDVEASVTTLLTEAAKVAPSFGIESPATISEFEALSELADVLGASPGVATETLQDEAWNSPPRAATALLDKGRKLAQLRAALAAKFADVVFDTEHAADIAYVEEKSSGLLSFLAFVDSRYRAIKKRWRAYRKESGSVSMLDQAHELKSVDQASALTRELDASEVDARPLFGLLWNGAGSDWSRLGEYVEYVVRYRLIALKRGLGEKAAQIARSPKPDVSALRALVAAAAELRTRLSDLRDSVTWPDGYLDASPIHEIGARARDLASNPGTAPGWAAFESSRQRTVATVAAEVVGVGMTGELRFADLARAFKRAFYMKWMSGALTAREPLRRFDTLTHEGLVKEFQELDRTVLRENRASLIGLLRDRAQHSLRQPDAAASLPRLRREMVKQRKHSPLRKTMRECQATIRAIKPCLMMSPLTVAQYLDGSTPTFDLVIFDEASQLPTEDAVGAVIRGHQLVVVGDPKQLPPTNFFAVSTGSIQVPAAEDGSPLYEDTESVLEEFMGAAVPMSRLKWHYRSAHESLISFSNVNFYDSDLHTFPSVVTDTDASGLQFHFVEGGIYEGKGVNLVEARRIADEVVAFAKVQLQRRGRGERTLSLGVGTLNLRQQLAILDELEVRRRDDPSIEPFFDRSVEEPFFVKNLENIQGDERDAIFLSITYGRSPDGRIRYNFGPLNRENGWRRLNVLVTRARRQMKVFSSMRDHDINPSGATSDGPRLLREFLTYAEHRRLGGPTVDATAAAESPFEGDVANELVRHGVRIEQQVGVCGYRMDIAVLDPDLPGRFVCGIECDGVAYHSMETVRDRDRLRQQVLEDRGWIIHRVWSTDWFKDRQGQIERLLRLIKASCEQVRTDEDQRQEALREETAVSAAADAVQQPPATPSQYSRPVLPAYTMCEDPGAPITGELLAAPVGLLGEIVTRVVDVEGPVHEAEVISRVSGFWGTKAGSRIQEAIRSGCRFAEGKAAVTRQGEFLWRKDQRCEPRSRAETTVPGDRVAPEEYAEVVKQILSDGMAFPRAALITEVRAAIGYQRTGPILEKAIGNAIDAMLAAGLLGEGSTGLVRRRSAES